ncbi:MAG: GNAT family N-acetyltransferase [Pseudomonadota bacterium]
MTVTIRKLQNGDRNGWEQLYHGYAEFYKVPMNDAILNTVWGWIFDESESFHCLVVEDAQGDLIGLMHFREMASPLRGKKVGFLDDLFIRPESRGEGAVEVMFDALAAAAKDNDWPFVRWITAEDNYRGRAVYDRLSSPTHWRTYQLDVAG